MEGKKFKLCVLLLIIVHIHGLKIEAEFNPMTPGFIAEGSIVHEKTVARELDCTIICSMDPHCSFYQYGKGNKYSCVGVGKNATQPRSLLSSQDVPVYKKDYCADNKCMNGGTCEDIIYSFTCHCVPGFTGGMCETNIDDCPVTNPCQNGGTCVDGINTYSCNCTCTRYTGQVCDQVSSWVAPSNWPSGDAPVYYHGFETNTDYTLNNGASLTTGHVGCSAIGVDETKSQWVDFGTHASAACILKTTCSTGGSMSVWLNIPPTSEQGGLVTSLASGPTGVLINPIGNQVLESRLQTANGFSYPTVTRPTGWFHFTSVYVTRTSYTIYINGHQEASGGISGARYPIGVGRLVIGKWAINQDNFATGEVDEMAFWNRALTAQEVLDLYNKDK